MKYRKKPVVIEAFQMTQERRMSNFDWPKWMHTAWCKDTTEIGALYPENFPSSDGTDRLRIATLEGNQLVSWGGLHHPRRTRRNIPMQARDF